MPHERLVAAAIALVRSEAGAAARLAGDPDATAFDPWPEMDALIAALDACAPGWRQAAATVHRNCSSDSTSVEGRHNASVG